MKKILYCVIALASLILHSCEKDTGRQNGEINGERISRILVQVPESQSSKVAIDGHVVTWKENDRLYLYPLGPIDVRGSYIEFKIDEKTISPDGKNAEFISQDSEGLVDGVKYVALTKFSSSSSGDTRWFSVSGHYANTQLGSGNNMHIVNNFVMSSNIITAQSSQMPTLYFNIEQSIIELDMKFKSSVSEEYEIESVALSIDNPVFTNRIGLYSDGFVGIKEEDNDSYIQSNRVVVLLDSKSGRTIGQDPYKVFIPVFWNELEEAIGDFTISIKTTNNKYSTVEFPTKELLDGTIYTKAIEFDAPVDSAQADKLTLLEIYHAWGGDSWNMHGNKLNWNINKPISEWDRVTINTAGRVNGLKLNGIYITSELTADIVAKFAQLTELETLDISENSITGSIPSNISLLKNLRTFRPSYNNITGSIPSSIGLLTKLKHLNLTELDLSGTIPSEIYNLINLEDLSFGGANLTGKISDKIGNLINLRYLYIESAGIDGELPLTIGNLINLKELVITETKMGGAIPATVAALTKLTGLFLINNKFSGSIPISLLNNENIHSLNLLFNNFESRGNEHLFTDQAAWNKWAMRILTQNAGYGFNEKFKNIYLEPADITLLDNTIINILDYFARNEYTIMSERNTSSEDDNVLSNTTQLIYKTYKDQKVSLLTDINNLTSASDYIAAHGLCGDFYFVRNDSFIDNWEMLNLHLVVDKNGKIVSSPLIDGYLTFEQLFEDSDEYNSGDKLLEFFEKEFGDIPPYLNVSSAPLNVQSSGGVETLKIMSNSSWTVSTTAPWISLSTKSGSNNADCVITFTKNTDGASRNSTIKFSGVGKTITVNVIQKAGMFDALIE